MPCTDAQCGHGQDCGYSFKGKEQRDKILYGYLYANKQTHKKIWKFGGMAVTKFITQNKPSLIWFQS